jgi:hypothetical protein
MGIDIYARWFGQTEEEKDAQIMGFCSEPGQVGYLREAYDGEPYATKVLVPEAFGAGEMGAEIPAALLRERLPETLKVAIERQRLISDEPVDSEETCAALQSYRDFVELCERKENENGEACWIVASA